MSSDLEQEFEIYASIAIIEETFQELEGELVADLSTTVRTVSSGIDALKKLGELALKSQNIELQEGIIELREHLLEVKESLLEIREENLTLREENKELRAQIEKPEEEKPILKNGLYYKTDGDGPFCTYCFDAKKQLIRLPAPLVAGLDIRRCPSCKTTFGR